MTSAFQRVLAFMPGPILAFSKAWIEPLQQLTILSNPDWQQQADNTVSAFSLVVALLGISIGFRVPTTRLLNWARAVSILWAVLAVGCAAIYLFMDRPQPRELVEILDQVWMCLYIAMATGLIALAVVFSVYFVREKL